MPCAYINFIKTILKIHAIEITLKRGNDAMRYIKYQMLHLPIDNSPPPHS